ncbi:MAG: hypothetical protein H6Q20_1541 [Bacteroidetes bacterium]|nr:hypothetical protein [Bacteroidota bacterium]
MKLYHGSTEIIDKPVLLSNQRLWYQISFYTNKAISKLRYAEYYQIII